MKMRKLGETKLKVSELSYACVSQSNNSSDIENIKSISCLHKAFEMGINFFDVSTERDLKKNEGLLNSALSDKLNQIVIATSVPASSNDFTQLDLSESYIKKSCDESLSRLGVDVIDLYYIPGVDKDIPIEETVRVMSELISEGKIRYIGISYIDLDVLLRAHQIYPITAIRSHYSLCHREAEESLIHFCENLQISFIAASPLNYRLNQNDHLAQVDANHTFKQFSESLLTSSDNVALSWLLSKSPYIIPLVNDQYFLSQENIVNNESSILELDNSKIQKLEQIFPMR